MKYMVNKLELIKSTYLYIFEIYTYNIYAYTHTEYVVLENY